MSSGHVFGSPEELSQHIGAGLGHTGWVEVTQQDVNDFARVTRDEQWIHVDGGRAANGPFGTTIAHGFFTLSLCSHFIEQLLVVRRVGMVVNYGLERVRFPAPLPIGSQVRASGQLLDVARREDAIRTITRLTIERDEGVRPVCVADQVSLFYGSED